MIELTPDVLSGSFVIVMITYAIAFVFQIFMAYLNYKQSKVNNQMEELLSEVRSIKAILKKK